MQDDSLPQPAENYQETCVGVENWRGSSPQHLVDRRLGEHLFEAAFISFYVRGGGHLLQSGEPCLNIGKPGEIRVRRVGRKRAFLSVAKLTAERAREIVQADGLSKRGFKLGSGTGLGQEPVISGAKLAPEPRPKCLDFPGPSQGADRLGARSRRHDRREAVEQTLSPAARKTRASTIPRLGRRGGLASRRGRAR